MAALVLAACGDGAGDTRTEEVPAAGNACADGARALTTLDLDGDGTEEELKLGVGASCAGVLLAQVGEGHVSGQVSTTALVPPVRVLRLTGASADLFTTRETHPRGGFQMHVFGLQGSAITELMVDGAPLVPFVATDTSGPGTSARCTPGQGIEVLSAVPESMGNRLDVTSRVFTITEGKVAAAAPRTVAEQVQPAEAMKKFPGLRTHAMFANC
ncbi:MAG: hypothetical protein EOO74_00705 [Myxococcales bacterium]|nr:MAG: hypothetical protein EOO74_00705 [Myxococcales bacterium]